MANRYKLEDCSQLGNKEIFFDANVLIYLFWPSGRFHFENNYARVFRALLRQGNTMFIDYLVLSEVINRILRIEHQKFNKHLTFKDFRNSSDGKEALSDIYTIVNDEILKRFRITGKSFNGDDIKSFLKVDDLDFVDKAVLSQCKENSMVLLTNDKDFRSADLDILTGNPKILN